MTDRRLQPGRALTDVEALAQDVALLHELEPEAGRLYDRHAKVAQEWFPHEYIPYRLGRDFDKEPWTPDQPRLSGVAQTAFETVTALPFTSMVNAITTSALVPKPIVAPIGCPASM